MSEITLEIIYKELMELKKKIERLEHLITIQEDPISEKELEEIKTISKQMDKGEKFLWTKQ